jgi:hypothetical protein
MWDKSVVSWWGVQSQVMSEMAEMLTTIDDVSQTPKLPIKLT